MQKFSKICKNNKKIRKNTDVFVNILEKLLKNFSQYATIALTESEGLILRKYFSLYTSEVIAALEDKNTDFRKLKGELLVKIGFMQHERLIHFLVTVLFALLMFMSLTAYFISQINGMLAASALMLILLVPYIAHYYFLENGVQKLYKIYDEVCKRADAE